MMKISIMRCLKELLLIIRARNIYLKKSRMYSFHDIKARTEVLAASHHKFQILYGLEVSEAIAIQRLIAITTNEMLDQRL